MDPQPLEYWRPGPPSPVAGLLAPRNAADRTDWLTMAAVVAIAAAGAFSIVIALAWVLGA